MNSVRVLIVEDEAFIALNLEWVVESLGYSVVGIAADSRKALEIAGRSPPDIALVDLNLADGRRGLEVAAALADSHGTTVIMATANPEGIVAREGGVFDIMRKPYDDAMIEASLARAAAQALPRPLLEAAPRTVA